MNERDVGVLIVARDAAATIDTALAGIAGQSSRPKAVVVVDDGSTDATADKAERWAGRLPLLVERLHQRSGVGVARRRGVALIEQPLVAQLDADDHWLTDHLHAMTSAHEPGRIVFARDLLWCPGAWLRENPRSLPEPAEQLRALVEGNLSSAGVLFERAACERVGGYRESLAASEDWDLYLRMVRAGAAMTLATEPTLLYRISTASTSAGYKTAETDVVVLEHALEEATSDDERGWVAASLARRRARRALSRALRSAESGSRSDARSHARLALHGGDRKTRAIAAALMIAPRHAASAQRSASRRRWSRPG